MSKRYRFTRSASGDGGGPFVSVVADLELFPQPSSPVTAPSWVLANHQSGRGLTVPTLATTDLAGRSDGLCERGPALFVNPSLLAYRRKTVSLLKQRRDEERPLTR